MKKLHLYKLGIAAAASLLVVAGLVVGTTDLIVSSAGDPPLRVATPFQFTPFTEELPIPPTVKPVAPFTAACTDQLRPEFGLLPPKFYEITMKQQTMQIIPGVDTPIWGYDGLYPGPLFKVRHNEPAIVRFHNDLNATTIVHNHGGHHDALSDGSADDNPSMLIPPGEFRDFCYPNIAPIEPKTGEQDMSDFASTQWYHDHAHLPHLDLGITGQNVYMGLAGYYWLFDDLERGLIDSNVLPADQFDIPIVLQDKAFAPDGQLIFDVNNFDGALGDVFVVNGKAQPKFTVERRKYRFRILNGSTARWWELKLSAGEFIQIGSDSWLLGEAVAPITFEKGGIRRDGTIRLGNAQRADVVIDFSNAPDEVFLENILVHDDGRRPKEARLPGTPILKFVVQGPAVENDAMVTVGTPLRPHKPILPEEIVATRTFKFERSGGQWVINGLPYNPEIDIAAPALGSAERWILVNPAGGWAHPIHVHLEAMQIQQITDRPIDPQERFKVDTVRLEPGDTAEVFIKFRTFPGRFVFHCHNVEHEDKAMMAIFNVESVPLEDFSQAPPDHPGDPPMFKILN